MPGGSMKTQNNLLKLGLIALTCFLLGLTVESKTRPLKVAIIDTGLMKDAISVLNNRPCKTGHLNIINGKDEIFEDTDGHGSMVTLALDKKLGKANVCYIIYSLNLTVPAVPQFTRVFKHIRNSNIRVVITSLSVKSFNQSMKRAFKSILHRNRVFFFAAMNEGRNLDEFCNVYPQCFKMLDYNRIFLIGSIKPDGDREEYSNYGLLVGPYFPGTLPTGATGTSFAAPRAAADYIKSLRRNRRKK